MIGEGFDIERPGGGDPEPKDPGRVARETAERIAQQVREVLQSADERAADIRAQAEADADAIRRDAAGAAARMLENVERLEDELEEYLTGFFDAIRREIENLAPRDEIQAAAQRTRELGAVSDPGEPRFEPLPESERAAEAEPESTEAEEEEPRRRRGLLRRRPRDEEHNVAARGADSDDAHVMALNMALNGTPRDETEGYLVHRFGQMQDLGAILDDVYGRVRGR